MIHIIKKNDIKEILSESCGKLNELYTGKEVDNNLSIVLGKNIGKTKPHFHSNNDEIYICVRGSLLVRLFDPETQESSKVKLEEDETIFIGKNVHHQIIESTDDCKFLAISNPYWQKKTEYISDKL